MNCLLLHRRLIMSLILAGGFDDVQKWQTKYLKKSHNLGIVDHYIHSLIKLTRNSQTMATSNWKVNYKLAICCLWKDGYCGKVIQPKRIPFNANRVCCHIVY